MRWRNGERRVKTPAVLAPEEVEALAALDKPDWYRDEETAKAVD